VKFAHLQDIHGTRRQYRRCGVEHHLVTNLLQARITTDGKELMRRISQAHNAAESPSAHSDAVNDESSTDALAETMADRLIKYSGCNISGLRFIRVSRLMASLAGQLVTSDEELRRYRPVRPRHHWSLRKSAKENGCQGRQFACLANHTDMVSGQTDLVESIVEWFSEAGGTGPRPKSRSVVRRVSGSPAYRGVR